MDLWSLQNQVIDDKFELISLLGVGGMGVVYKAHQAGIERSVAVKLLAKEWLDDESRARFEREAKSLSELKNEHIGAFYSYGIWQELPYIAMEYIEGNDLSELLAKSAPIDWKRAAKIMIQVCEAMEHAHKAGVIHRDLKPGNILICDSPYPEYVKIVDFGLSKIIAKDEKELQKLTQTGHLLGSINYMSPELCQGKAVDFRSDIYSLGCIFYECICKEPPHTADTPIGVIHKHVHEALILPSEKLKQKLPKELDHVVAKALRKDSSKRYQSMQQFKQDLLSLASDQYEEITVEAVTSTPPEAKRPSMVVLTIGLSALAAGILFLLFRPQLSNKETDHSSGSKVSAATTIIDPKGTRALIEQYKILLEKGISYQRNSEGEPALKYFKQALALPVPQDRLDLRLDVLNRTQAVVGMYSAAARPYIEEMLALTVPSNKAKFLRVSNNWNYKESRRVAVNAAIANTVRRVDKDWDKLLELVEEWNNSGDAEFRYFRFEYSLIVNVLLMRMRIHDPADLKQNPPIFFQDYNPNFLQLLKDKHYKEARQLFLTRVNQWHDLRTARADLPEGTSEKFKSESASSELKEIDQFKKYKTLMPLTKSDAAFISKEVTACLKDLSERGPKPRL